MKKSVADQTENAPIYAISDDMSQPYAKLVTDQHSVNAQIFAICVDMSQPYAKVGRRPADCGCADRRDQR